MTYFRYTSFSPPELITLAGMVMAVTILLSPFKALATDQPPPWIIEDAKQIAFTGANLIDGTGAMPKAQQTVVINNGRIEAIYPDGTQEIKAGTTIIPLNGQSLLPGWVLLHEHLFFRAPYTALETFINQPIAMSKLYLASGVTSARTAGSLSPYFDLRVQEAISQNTLPGPDYDLTAPFIEGGKGAVIQQHVIGDQQDIRAFVDYWADQGFTSFKAYLFLDKTKLKQAIEAVHRRGLKITAHLEAGATYREAAALGIDQIEHGFMGAARDLDPNHRYGSYSDNYIHNFDPQSPSVQSFIRYLVEQNITLTSTQDIIARSVSTLAPVPAQYLQSLREESRQHYQSIQQRRSEHSARGAGLVTMLQSLELAFWQAGGKLVLGSDSILEITVPGFGSLASIEMLAQSGIPNLEVIKIATLNGAEAMGVDDDRGSIAVGKRADLIITNADPSIDINAIWQIDKVVKAGVIYDPQALIKATEKTIGG